MVAASLSRAIVAWVPDWPVVAALQSAPQASEPVALIEKGLVFACSAAARAAGVKRGLRVREAQARCPSLAALPYDPVLDTRAFEPVLGAVEQLMPGVQVIRPGMCALRARGPSRYYGGEQAAADALLTCLAAEDFPAARVGVADGLFAAEHAARSAAGAALIIPAGDSPRFLAPLPVDLLGDAALVPLLHRLGVHTLGAFAALDPTHVRDRFGEAGARAHALAAGSDPGAVAPRPPQRDLDVAVDFEPPLDRVDQVTFAFRTAADRFIAHVTDVLQVCTSILVTVHSESGEVSERTWLHPRWFTAADVVDRVRWQLQSAGDLRSPIARVAVAPGNLDAIGNHEEGLWGTAPDERIHHGLSRIQGILGHEGVLTPVIGGGRMLADRQVLVPWGDRPPASDAAKPWPGSLPAPLPSSVFAPPRPATVLDAAGDPVTVDARGNASAPPVRFGAEGAPALQPVTGWAGPWPIDERWWDAAAARRAHRFQVVGDDGTAWLLLCDGIRWLAEARYD